MKSLKSKASKFFNLNQAQAQAQAQVEPKQESQSALHVQYRYAKPEDEFDALASDKEGEDVVSNIPLRKDEPGEKGGKGKEKVKKKPSRLLLRKPSNISASAISSPLPGPSAVAPPLPPVPTTAPTDESKRESNKSDKSAAQSLRSKASRFFRSSSNSTTSHPNSKTNSISTCVTLPSPLPPVTVAFTPPPGPPPPRPQRPDSLDQDIIDLIRSKARVCLPSGSTISTPTSSSFPSVSTPSTSTFAEANRDSSPPVRLSAAMEHDNSVTPSQIEGEKMVMEQYCPERGEYHFVRRSAGSAGRAPGTLWKDDRGFLHFVHDM